MKPLTTPRVRAWPVVHLSRVAVFGTLGALVAAGCTGGIEAPSGSAPTGSRALGSLQRPRQQVADRMTGTGAASLDGAHPGDAERLAGRRLLGDAPA